MASLNELAGINYFTLLVLVAVYAVIVSSSSERLSVKLDKTSGDFQILMADKLWFSSVGVLVRSNGKWYSSLDDTLSLSNAASKTMDSPWGSYEMTNFTWSSTDGFKFTSYIKIYKDQPIVVFGQCWDVGGVKTSISGNNKGSIGYWPTFNPESLGNTGYMTYSGNFAAFMKFGSFDQTTPVYSNIDGGFPLAVFDKEMNNAVIISPLDTFMSASLSAFQLSEYETPLFGLGIVPNVDSVPKGYTMETILVAGQNVTGTMAEWGSLLRSKYGKDDSYRLSDPSINYLGYYTDNGACYYYDTGTYSNYEEAIMAVKKASVDHNLPYQYLQLDSWWYYKGAAGGVKNWTAMDDVFPHGIDYVSKKTDWNIVAHNRYWSNNTDYAKKNGGKFDFVLDSNGYALPNDNDFWKYLLSTAKNNWNLMVYEQDWLDREYQHLQELQSQLNLGEVWLNSMGAAAIEVGVTIQYCMPWTRHILQSLSNSAVTQIRVSDDYQPGNGQWQVGDTTMLAHAVGLASFKDTFRTLKTESNCKFMQPEPYPELETYVAGLTGGPVGPSDTEKDFNRTLIMANCMADGLLLKPTQPAISLDQTFLYRAFGSGGPNGDATAAYTEISGFTWYFILAANVSKDYNNLTAAQLPPSPSVKPQTYLPLYIGVSTKLGQLSSSVLTLNSNDDVIPIHACGKEDFQYWVLAPVLPGINAALFGELDKVVTVSEQRFSNITMSNDNEYMINVMAAKEETVNLYTYDIEQKTVVHGSCSFKSAGKGKITLGKGGKITC